MAGLTAWQRLLDFVDDVRLNVLRRPLRMLLLGIGTALAVAIYAGSTLIASASATAVNEVFDELAATRLQVDLPIDSRRNPEPDEHDIAAIRDLPDVVDAATIWSDGDASLISLRRPWLRIDRLVPVYSYWGSTDVIGLSVDGTTPDESVASTEVLIGAGLRGRLGLDVGDDVELDGRPTRIVGVITESPQLSDLLLGVVEFIPDPSLPPPKKGKLFVQVRVGSAERTGDILPWILIPGAPEVVLVRYPPEATRLRNAVVTKVDAAGSHRGRGDSRRHQSRCGCRSGRFDRGALPGYRLAACSWCVEARHRLHGGR